MDTISIWDAAYDNNGYARYEKIWSQKYPSSIGLLYSAFTKRVGLRPLDEEYILMGMVAYGEPKYVETIKERFLNKDYTLKEVQRIRKKFYETNSNSVVTTEKDAVKLTNFAKELDDIDIFFLKIKLIMDDEKQFDEFLFSNN